MTTPTPADAVRATAADIPPGPYSEHDLREQWNAQAADGEDWDSLESCEQLAWAQARAIAADRGRTAQPIAWCRSIEFSDAAMKQQSFNGWRQQHSDCDMALYGVPVPIPPATGEVQELAEWLSLTGENAGQWSEEDADHYDRAATLLQQQEANLATTREALRRLVAWGGFRSPSAGYNSDVVLGVADWFANGMTSPLPPLPPYIRAQLSPPLRAIPAEPTTSAPALPPAITYGCGDGVRISAANRERTSWAVRDGLHRLNSSGEWEPELNPSSRDAAFETRTRWPSAEAAWNALLKYRAGELLANCAAAEGVEG